jgi:hypothetical protein
MSERLPIANIPLAASKAVPVGTKTVMPALSIDCLLRAPPVMLASISTNVPRVAPLAIAEKLPGMPMMELKICYRLRLMRVEQSNILEDVDGNMLIRGSVLNESG